MVQKVFWLSVAMRGIWNYIRVLGVFLILLMYRVYFRLSKVTGVLNVPALYTF